MAKKKAKKKRRKFEDIVLLVGLIKWNRKYDMHNL